MEKLYFLITFFIFNFFFSQTDYVLKLKFNEKHFLSSFIRNNTKNEFVLNAFRKADSITENSLNYNYVNILDSVLKNEFKISKRERLSMSDLERKQHDSISIEIKNGSLLSLYKKVVQAYYDSEFLQKTLDDSGIEDFKITQTDYNQFSISFISKGSLEKSKTLFHKNRLSFHESIDENQLENIQNCFMNENDLMVKNNYLKKEKNYLLIYKDDPQLFGDSYEKSKCFEAEKITFLLDYGEDSNVFSKLFFVKQSNNLENKLVNSIIGFNISFKKNKEIYNDNYFYLSIYLNNSGKENLSEISEQNIGKKIFTANNFEFISNLKISSKIRNGIFISGNLFEENWQKLSEMVKFEVFRNSLDIQ